MAKFQLNEKVKLVAIAPIYAATEKAYKSAVGPQRRPYYPPISWGVIGVITRVFSSDEVVPYEASFEGFRFYVSDDMLEKIPDDPCT